ncbi:conserved Plasmodium protein, unknown function [Plasmodium relictum]|uniref:RanBP2-type domain-containing protein n=1 Tax=Plasmodium relictum TaxID=85471 RepID=A0A1J1HC13_PLARL|nr:conserved Plasmodium protein, unknown function [Plasmodium relictum]CRH02988.1 conserved Plasmodium protein, unknown function [Plasmodium relictum]
MKKKYDKSSKIYKSHKSKIKNYDEKKKRKYKCTKYDDGASNKLYKETKSNKKISNNYNTNLLVNNKNKSNKNSQVSYNSYDYFNNNVSEYDLSSNYIVEEKLKYEKEVFERAYGLSLDDICYDNSLFKKENGNINNNKKKNEESKKYYECFSCKTKNYYSNVQCYKCKKLRKL